MIFRAPQKDAWCRMVQVSEFLALHDVDNIKLDMLSLHVFTGRDATSVFGGKGKVKPLKILLKTIHY